PAASGSTRSAACFQVIDAQSPFSGMRKASLSPDFSTRCKKSCAKFAAPVEAALPWLIGLPSESGEPRGSIWYDDPLRPAFAALAIVINRHDDPPRPAFAALAIVMLIFVGMPTS